MGKPIGLNDQMILAISLFRKPALSALHVLTTFHSWMEITERGTELDVDSPKTGRKYYICLDRRTILLEEV